MTTTREKRRDALADLSHALKVRTSAFAIHYACDSFDAAEARILAIAARNMGNNATESFSLDATAGAMGVDLKTASPAEIDSVERKLLDAFSSFLARNAGSHWLHWNMRDAKYGFDALEARHRKLKGRPTHVPAANRFDLSARLFDLYGDRHGPKAARLQAIAAKNGITLTDFTEWPELGRVIAAGDFKRVTRSTLRKADVLFEIADRAHRNRLKTDAKPLDAYGGWSGWFAYLKDHPVYLALVVIGPLLAIGLTVWRIWKESIGAG